MKKFIFSLFFLLSILSFSDEVSPPNFFLQDQYKIEHSLEKYQGNDIILLFWSSWCGYCRDELKIIEKLYQTTQEKEKDLTILTFNNEEEKILSDFLKDNNYSFPIINNSDIFQYYYIDSFPTFYFINKNGKIEKIISGYLNEEEILEILNKK